MISVPYPSGVGSVSGETAHRDREQNRNGQADATGAKMADRAAIQQVRLEEDIMLTEFSKSNHKKRKDIHMLKRM